MQVPVGLRDAKLEVDDDDLAVHVPAGLQLDRGVDLLDRKLAAMGTRRRPSATSRAISSMAPAAAPFAEVIPLTWGGDGGDALGRNAGTDLVPDTGARPVGCWMLVSFSGQEGSKKWTMLRLPEAP